MPPLTVGTKAFFQNREVTITGIGEEAGETVYDNDSGHWGYAHQYEAVPPFKMGQHVLAKDAPWAGSLVVQSCIPHARGGYRLTMSQGNSECADMASRYIPVPIDWVDPPSRPCFKGPLPLADYGQHPLMEQANAEHQAELASYHIAYVRWAETHLRPLGDYEDHIINWRAMVDALDAEPVEQERAA